MGSERTTASELSFVVWDEREARAVDQRRVELPPGLDVDGVRWFVEQRYGPVRGVVHAAGSDGPPIGWTLPVEAVPELAREHTGTVLLVVAYGRAPDGTLHELTPGGRRLAEERPVLGTTSRAGVTIQVGGWLRRMLEEGHTYLLLELGEDARYVQYATHDGSWLRGEVVGSVHVPDRPLTPAEEAAILDVGWHPPTGDPDSGPGGVNHWMEWGDPSTGEPVDVQDAAELTAATLCALGVDDPAQVRIETGPSHPGRVH